MSPSTPRQDTSLRFFLLLGLAAVVCGGAGYLGVNWLKAPPAPPSAMSPMSAPTSATAMSAAPLPHASGAAPHDTGMDQMTGMVERLAQKLKGQPNNAEGWAMLARSYGVLGRHAESLKAYEKALTLRKGDVVLQTDYARELVQASAAAKP